MKKTAFSLSLFLTTALIVSGCDQNQDGQSSDSKADENAAFYSNYTMETPPPTFSGSFLVGQYAQNKSDWKNASDNFLTILETTPQDHTIQRRVMVLEMGSGNYDKAVAIAEKISKGSSNDKALANLILALSHFKAGQFEESLKNVETYKDDALGVALLPLLKSWAMAGEGKTSIQNLKDSPSLLYQSVLIAGYTKDKESISQLAKTYNFITTPTPVSRLEDIASIFGYYGEKDAARNIYTALKKGIPDRASIYEQKIKDMDGTTSPVLPKQLTSPQIGFSEAIFDMAQILSNGYQESARLFAHMSLYLNPDNPSALELLAQIASDNQLYTDATTYLSQIDTANNPDKKIQISRQIAQLQVLAGNEEEGIRILEEVVSTHKNVDAQIQIADIYRSQEKYKEALNEYNKAYSLLGNNITADYWGLSFSRGMINERLKNWEQAEKDLKIALTFEPDQPYVLNYLGYSWADQGINLDKAAEMIEKAVRLKPDDGSIVDSLGWIYFQMKQFDKAVVVLEKAIELSPTEPEINDHLGDAYWKVGRKSEARFQWSRAKSFTTDETLLSTLQSKIDNGLSDKSQSPQESPAKIVENKSSN